ncbi:ATP-binding domain-containing protein [bacterium BFN5]|nr:ATP-binding domain-containing protein [bacterium BFN5]
MVNIIRGAIEKPVAAYRLEQYFEQRTDIDGVLYLGYPIIGSIEGSLDVDAILISRSHGIVIFDLVEGVQEVDRTNIQDVLYTQMNSKLLQYSNLTSKRNLMVQLGVITYAPGWVSLDLEIEQDVAIKDDELTSFLNAQDWEHSAYYEKLLQAIQAITTIRNKPKREKVTQSNSRGAILKRLEESIANLDSNQSAAVIETADGPQRIRGLAGSGKTIVLALKVAYLHSKYSDWDIAVTFNTRALRHQFEDLITKFTIEHKKDKPDWTKVHIIHAWGSPRQTGIYYEFCKSHGIEYLDFQTAKENNFTTGQEFTYVCKKALSEVTEFKPKYDVILVDEAQDFSKEFLVMCYEFLRDNKRLIFAYDELQSLNKQSMDTPENIFGKDHNGNPRVQLKNEPGKPKQDIILKQCYRNSRPVLVTAHALGFGIYRENVEPIIQMFEQKSLWKDSGYEILEGSLEDGHHVCLGRTNESSPRFLEEHSSIDDLIEFRAFENNNDQTEWLVNSIIKNITEDELEYQDIVVIHTDPRTTTSAVAPIRSLLFSKNINSHVAGITFNPESFYEKDSITFTSIYRAKGNEAAMVYVIDAQNCFDGYELSRKRNILFTAITRSKAWVRVCGYGNDMNNLSAEFSRVKDKNFTLDFDYPTADQRQRMNSFCAV